MLSEELIKKAAPFADGFEIHRNLSGGYLLEYKKNDEKRYVIGSDCDLELYEHFLTRVIEGINKINVHYRIVQERNYLEVYLNNKHDIDFEISDNIDQDKEQTIKYILEKL